MISFSTDAVSQINLNLKVKDQVYLNKALQGDAPAPGMKQGNRAGEKSHGLSEGGDLNTLYVLHG